MKIKTKLLAFLFAFAFSIVSIAQSPIDYIPQNATMVMSMNPNHLNKKVSIEQLTQLSFFQDMLGGMSAMINPMAMEDMQAAIASPSEYGMDFMSNSYMVMDMNDEGSFFSYIFKINDAQKASDFFKSQATDDDMGFGAALKSADGFQYLDTPGGKIAWNNNIGMMLSGNVEYEFEEYSDEEFNESDSLNQVSILDYMNRAMQMPDNNIKGDARFVADNKTSDMHIWMDYEYIQKLNSENAMPEELAAYGLDMAYEQLMSMYDGTYISMAMNFNKGVMDMATKTYMNPNLAKMWKGAMSDFKMNKKLHKYIKGRDMMGYFSMNYGVENSVEATKAMVYDMLGDIPFVGEMAGSGLDILGIFIDEEAIYNLIKGDMVFAVTGMNEFEKEMTTYEYDDDFNQKEVTKMVKQTLPEFTMAMSYGNKNDMMKFVRLGEQFGTLQAIGKYFKINSEELPMDIFMALNDGVMLFTNDRDLVSNRLSSGYPKKQRMKKSHCKTLMNSATTFFWDIPQTLNAVEALGMPSDFTSNKMMKMSKDTFESILFTADKTINGNVSAGNLKFNFTNKQQNSIEQFFNFINDIYISEMGGRSM